MKNKLIFSAILIMLAVNCFTQVTKKYFTIYSNGYLELFDDPVVGRKEYQAICFFPSFAYQKEINKLSYQIDLMPFLFNARNYAEIRKNNDHYEYLDGFKLRSYESSLGLILKYWILVKEKVRINIVFENRLYFVRNLYDPYNQILYRHSDNNYGLSTSLGFELEMPINDEFSITAMPLYRINEFYLKQNWTNNPSVSESLRTVYAFHNSFNPLKFNLKIGLKIKI